MKAQNSNFASALETLVMSMPVAQTLKLKFNQIAAGKVELTIPYQDEFSFRSGQLQAMPIFAAADFAAVSAAAT